MRLGRIILASLASLYALAAATTTSAHAPSTSPQLTAADLPRLFQAVVPLLIGAADSASAVSPGHPSAHAVLALEALAATPFRGSLWLLASPTAVDLRARSHQRTLLRC